MHRPVVALVVQMPGSSVTVAHITVRQLLLLAASLPLLLL
jgi:hypothetical protein